jgi:hypothetical protein
MLTKVETITDYQKLPSTIRHIIEGGKGKILKAEKSYALQNAVALAVRNRDISRELAIEILKANYAYGKRGKAALEEITL